MSQRRRREIATFTKARGTPFLRPLRWLYVLSPVVAALLLLGVWLFQREAMFTRGPLSPGHAVLSHDCQQCHHESFRQLRFPDRRQAEVVINRDCLRCHQRTIGHSEVTQTATHHERVPGDGLPCAGCHAEHQGRVLKLVEDGPCLSCHTDLRKRQPDIDVAQRITAFAAVTPTPGDGGALHPEFRLLAEKRPDPGVLQFNHRRHLFSGRLPGPDGRGVALTCQDCHRPEGVELPWRFGGGQTSRPATSAKSLLRGEQMTPISYASHCAGCHRLPAPRQAGELHGVELRGDDTVARGEVPHATPAAIRTYLRGQLAASPQFTFPIEEEILSIEQALYRTEGQSGPGCAKCHQVKTGGANAAELPIVVPTALPSRFLPRARFNHAKHTAASLGGYDQVALSFGMADCLACHVRAADSTRTSDVLIPGIVECRRCHAPSSGQDAASRGGITTRCTTCHSYHVPPPQGQGPTPVAEGARLHAPLPSLVEAGRYEVRRGLAKSTPLWPMSAFFELPQKVWGLPQVRPGTDRFRQELFTRYGLFPADTPNDGLPLGLLRTERTYKGEPGITVTCEYCHSSSLFGQLVIGQQNPFSDMDQIWIDLGLVSGEPGADPLYAKTPLRNTVVNGADHLALLGLYFRNPDYSINYSRTLKYLSGLVPELKAEFDELSYIKTPPWYTYATRKSGAFGLYADGGQPKSSNFAAYTYVNTFRDLDGQDFAAALVAWKRSGPAFIGSLQPPRYPFALRAELVTRGRTLYDVNCSRCHGSYAPGDTSPEGLSYPGLVYPLAEIKTDPKRAHFSPGFAARMRSVLKEEYTMTGGYVAPPLTAIWARAPYLHNGSVPTLAELLDPPTRRGKYLLVADPNNRADYDQSRVGWRVETPHEGMDVATVRRLYDASRLPGLSNSGHLYGAELTAVDRTALIEFLKTL